MLGHGKDFKRSAGGFIHGFRYTARALFRTLSAKYEDTPWPMVRMLDAVCFAYILVCRKLIDLSSALYVHARKLIDLSVIAGAVRPTERAGCRAIGGQGISNDESCIDDDECCIQNDECCIQNDLDLLPDRQRGWELPDGTRVG